MRELEIEQRLIRIEDNVEVIKQMLEKLLNRPVVGPPVEDPNEIMSAKQVAQYLGLDANVIYSKCVQGDIPHFKIGKGYRFKKSDIEQWIQGKKEKPEISVDDFVDKYMQTHILKG
jgi:excisionase family DNA binding protein